MFRTISRQTTCVHHWVVLIESLNDLWWYWFIRSFFSASKQNQQNKKCKNRISLLVFGFRGSQLNWSGFSCLTCLCLCLQQSVCTSPRYAVNPKAPPTLTTSAPMTSSFTKSKSNAFHSTKWYWCSVWGPRYTPVNKFDSSLRVLFQDDTRHVILLLYS